MDETLPHIEVKNLRKEFFISKGSWFGSGNARKLVAVDDVSFEIKRGECLGLVGESGSGKTTLGLALAKLISSEGRIVFLGEQIEHRVREPAQIVDQVRAARQRVPHQLQ